MMTAAIYARVANSEEHIDDQLIALRKLGAQLGYTVVEYTDIVSGTKARRPGLDALLRDARRGMFAVVLVADCHRIAKSARHFLQTVDELGRLDIEFVSLQDEMGTTRTTGTLFLTVARSILKLHADLNKELIRAGMRRRKLEGYRLGRQPLDVDHTALVRDRLSGMSLTDTARKYGVSRASVVRFVRESQKQFAGMEFRPDTNAVAVESVA
jgi:DNA invertase Pin-like site-specific DNA recombinase